MRRKKLSTIMIAAVMMLSVAFVATTTGNYIVDQYDLDMSVNPTLGGTTIPPIGTHTYDEGTVVDIDANANPGWVFDHWDGDVDDSSNQKINSVTMDENQIVTAHFAQEDYTLTVNVDPDESGSVGVAPDGPYHYNNTVTLTPIPNIGWVFDQWDGDVIGTGGIWMITMDDDKDVIAYFDPIPGIKIFEGAGNAIGGSSNDVLNTSTDDIYYGQEIDIEVNSSFGWPDATSPYFLWYPKYTGKLGEDYSIDWIKWEPGSGNPETIDKDDNVFKNVCLNNTGIWLIGPSPFIPNPDISTKENMYDTVPAWFWVNGTKESLDIVISDNNVYYNDEKDITINVTTDGESLPVLIDVRYAGDSILGGNELG